jgi:predicted nucleotidyltransferase
MALLAVGPSVPRADDSEARTGVVLSRDPGNRPLLSYGEFVDRHGPPAPLVAGVIVEESGRGGTIIVAVNSTLYPSISAAVDQYLSDLLAAGYSVSIQTVSGGTPASLRSYIQGQAQGLAGVVFIGDLPIAWFEIDYDFDGTDPDQIDNEYAAFPCDLFYMDLDGSWADQRSTTPFQAGVYDVHAAGNGDQGPEIWVSRLTTSTLTYGGATQSGLTNNYLSKNHRFREALLRPMDRALVYVDDDWVSWASEIDGFIGASYPDRALIDDSYTTCRADFRDTRLIESYEWMHVMLHSSWWEHYFKVGGAWEMIGENYATVTAQDIQTIDPIGAFYNFYACSGARYVESNYLAGWYVFGQENGLGAVGTTKTGGMWDYGPFYSPIGAGGTLGMAFRDWLTSEAPYDSLDVKWFYGMTVLGDGALATRPRATVDPVPFDTDAPVTAPIVLDFDRPMNSSTFSQLTFSASGGQSGRRNGSYSYDPTGNRLIFDPSEDFQYGEAVDVVMSRKIRSAECVAPTGRAWFFHAGVGNPTAGTFATWNSTTVMDVLYDVICSDWNRDGFADLATAADGVSDGRLAILTNDRSGTYSVATYTGPDGLYFLACGDFDGDYDTDIVTSNTTNLNNQGLSVYRNNGNGTFGSATNLWSYSYPNQVHVGDVDLDGDLDLIAMANPNSNQHYLEFYANNGSGAFTSSVQYFVRTGCALSIQAMGDLDGDGDLDLIGHRVGDYSVADDSLAVYLNLGDGQFTSPIVTRSLPDGACRLGLGDFDRDGDLDAASTSSWTNWLTILHNDGAGEFTQVQQIDVGGSNSFDICPGDWDGDGDLDLAQGISYPTGAMYVVKNDGGGTFSGGTSVAMYFPRGVAFGDFDRDRDIDLAAVTGGAISTLRNAGAADARPPERIADLRGSRDLTDTITLYWTAPGDDGSLGRAAQYAMRYSTIPVPSDTSSWWNAATAVAGLPTPSPAGVTDRVDVGGLTVGQSYYFLLRAADEVPNWSPFSNVWREDVGSDVGEAAAAAVLDCWAEPNPLCGRTRVGFSLPYGGNARLTIHDLAGRRVATLHEGDAEAGPHAVAWRPIRIASGVYFIRLEFAGQTRTRQIVLLP